MVENPLPEVVETISKIEEFHILDIYHENSVKVRRRSGDYGRTTYELVIDEEFHRDDAELVEYLKFCINAVEKVAKS